MPDLGLILQQCWQALETGASKAGHPFHLAVVGSQGNEETQLRMVVLRQADRQTRSLWFHTDSRSRKALELLKFGHASWLFFDPGDGVQIRVQSRVNFHQKDALCHELWQGLPVESRVNYSSRQSPGKPMVTAPPSRLEDQDAFLNFLVIECIATHIDWLRLSPDGHQRAKFHWNGTSWRGCRVAP
jgi:pyridoxine/pyridoxamine 5'-phosphate oxidase